MTRSPVIARLEPARRVASLHRRGDGWRLVVLEASTPPRVLEASAVPGAVPAALAEAHARHRFERVVRVAPGRETIARSGTVPTGRPEETASALALLAEAQLPGTLPPHRRAAGVIPDGSSNGTRAVLLTGWEGRADPPGPIIRRVPEVWTTEIAALAVLRGARSAWAASADAGAVSILVTGRDRTAARVLIEDAGTPARFRQAAARAVAETCAAVGIELPARELPALALDSPAAADLRRRVLGVPDDRAWLEEYGIALGAALAAADDDPLTSGLASLLEAAPARRTPIVRRAASWLARPRHAAATIAVCAAVMLLVPLLFAWARLAILEGKSAGLADRAKLQAEHRLRTALYEQLAASRLPMTKLLADASAAAPVGVVANAITITPDQGVAIQGTADNPGLVDTFQANLNATRLFGSVKVSRVVASGSGVEFDLSAAVANPHARAAGAEDFAGKPLAVRLYGEGASNATAPVGGSGADTSRASASRPARRDSERAPAERSPGDEPRESRRPSAGSPDQPPPPLSDAEIASMDRAAATREWVSRRTFPQRNPTIDAGTKARLEDEVRRLRGRMDATRGGGS